MTEYSIGIKGVNVGRAFLRILKQVNEVGQEVGNCAEKTRNGIFQKKVYPPQGAPQLAFVFVDRHFALLLSCEAACRIGSFGCGADRDPLPSSV